MECNRNLITLKCVVFLFFGGLGCLYPFIPLHMMSLRLTSEEAEIISIVAPCVAIIGPLVAGPLADKLAGGSGGKPRSKNGMYLKIMLAICLILSAIFSWLLMAVPTIEPCLVTTIESTNCSRFENTAEDSVLRIRPDSASSVALVCDKDGGQLLVEKCSNGIPCDSWEDSGVAMFSVTNCTYTCQNESPRFRRSQFDPDASLSNAYFDSQDEDNGSGEESPIEAVINKFITPPPKPVPHPHLCYTDIESNQQFCHVYSFNHKPVQVVVPLSPYLNNTQELGMCRYPIKGDFHCRMGPKIEKDGASDITTSCNPTIKCNVYKPTNQKAKIYIQPKCSRNTGSFWWYLIIKSIADIFLAAAVTLLDAAIIIATRETSTGRGDAGKQFAMGALGLAIFAPIVGAVHLPIVATSLFTLFMIIAALILLCDSKMPLSPPEWWWHTRCGLLAIPMSSVRRYSLETAALGVILLLLGIFWNGIDPFLPWRIMDLSGNELNVGLTITVGALPAVLFLIYIEKIVDYCGHNNLLIAAFTFYIIHYTALYCIRCPWLLLLCEALEVFTLHVMWVTAVFYLRHLIPRRFTVSGQALPVIAHFCLGRLLGGLLGGLSFPKRAYQVEDVYEGFATAAAMIAIIYFLSYHLYFKPKCAAPMVEVDRPTPALIQSVNGNGTYTPLRVYHNSRAKKGQFKY